MGSLSGKFACGVMLFAYLGGAVSLAQNGTPGSKPPYNIIFITPDQMSADFMHAYGSAYADTPNIDKLAGQGALFLHAYTAAPWTTPSFSTVFTSLFPTVHGMTLPPYEGCGLYITKPIVNGKIPAIPPAVDLSPHKLLLSELLKEHGMTTAMDNANCWSIFYQVGRGWDTVKFLPGYQFIDPSHPDTDDPFYLTAPKTLTWAQDWLRIHHDEHFFLWVHFMEPHDPFNAPRSYDRFKTQDDFPNLYEDNSRDETKLNALAKIGNVHAIRRLDQLYAAKIMYVDHYIGELVKTIHDLGLDKNSIIVFLSDHGQLMYSHPEDFNTVDHRSLYDADLHVPVIIRGPRIPAGRRVDAIVSHYDILPTILDLENLAPLPGTDGTSLKPLLLGTATQVHRYVYGEETALEPQYSIRDTRYKLIESLRDGRIQCFDTEVDAGEKHNICDQIPRRAAELKHDLDEHIQAMIEQAKSYPDWKNNIGLAVAEQRDSESLRILAPGNLTVGPSGSASFQLGPQGWSLAKNAPGCPYPCYLSSPGAMSATVVWRFDTPMTGEYDVFIRYGDLGRLQAKKAVYTVRFKGGTLSLPIDQNRNQNQWMLLGRFRDPISVELTNLADGPVVAGAVRFHRIETGAAASHDGPHPNK